MWFDIEGIKSKMCIYIFIGTFFMTILRKYAKLTLYCGWQIAVWKLDGI